MSTEESAVSITFTEHQTNRYYWIAICNVCGAQSAVLPPAHTVAKNGDVTRHNYASPELTKWEVEHRREHDTGQVRLSSVPTASQETK